MANRWLIATLWRVCGAARTCNTSVLGRNSRFLSLIFIACFTPTTISADDISIARMAGQMIVVGFTGTSVDSSGVKSAASDVAAGRVGGVMYLKTNISSLENAKKMNAVFRAASPTLPPFITLDQEGGNVERLTSAVGFTEIPTAAVIARSGLKQAATTYGTMASGIAALGFNTNFGPVVDLATNPKNPVIAKFGRAYSADANNVAQYASTFVAAHRAAGVLTVLKHFPGHGSSAADSHEGFVDITRTWEASELAPYRALNAAGMVDMIMVGHLYNAHYADPGTATQLPATLSRRWINGVLRTDVGFDGVVISDDMEMGAVRSHFSRREAAILAVRAGVDILLYSNTAKPDPGLGAEIQQILVSEAEKDPAFAARIAQSYSRIVTLKRRLN